MQMLKTLQTAEKIKQASVVKVFSVTSNKKWEGREVLGLIIKPGYVSRTQCSPVEP